MSAEIRIKGLTLREWRSLADRIGVTVDEAMSFSPKGLMDAWFKAMGGRPADAVRNPYPEHGRQAYEDRRKIFLLHQIAYLQGREPMPTTYVPDLSQAIRVATSLADALKGLR